MADNNLDMSLNMREMASSVTVSVSVKENRYWGLGLLFIRVGCWIAGLSYKDKT